MIQEIITYIIVGSALFFAGIYLYKKIKPSKIKETEGCGSCTGCTLKDIKADQCKH